MAASDIAWLTKQSQWTIKRKIVSRNAIWFTPPNAWVWCSRGDIAWTILGYNTSLYPLLSSNAAAIWTGEYRQLDTSNGCKCVFRTWLSGNGMPVRCSTKKRKRFRMKFYFNSTYHAHRVSTVHHASGSEEEEWYVLNFEASIQISMFTIDPEPPMETAIIVGFVNRFGSRISRGNRFTASIVASKQLALVEQLFHYLN